MSRIVQYAGIAMLLMLAVACGNNAFEGIADKNTDEAKQIELQERLDSGDYSYIVAELAGRTDLTPGEQVILASAYTGDVNVDTTRIMESAADNTLDAFGVISAAFGTNTFDNSTIDNNTDAFSDSLAALTTTTDEDVAVFKGIVSALDIILAVGEIVLSVDNVTTVTLTEDGISNALGTTELAATDITGTQLTRIDNALTAVAAAIATLSSGSDVADDFTDFLTDIRGGDSTLTAQDVACYINYGINTNVTSNPNLTGCSYW